MSVVKTEIVITGDELIFYNLDPVVAKAMTVTGTDVEANEAGRKIVPTGAILSAAGEVVNDASARFILAHAVDVTDGPTNGTGVYRATAYQRKLPVVPSVAAAGAMRGMIFMDDNDNYL